MNSLLLNMVLRLAERLPWDQLLELVRYVAIRRIPAPLMVRIENLVAQAENIGAPGPDKFRWVIEKLTGPESSMREVAIGIAGHVLRWAIESAVLRLKSNER